MPLSRPATASRRFRWSFAALLAALATLGPFSIDAYLPAFSGIQDSLAASPLEIQQTLSAYLFAFGLMFLFHGALSDSFGRRPVILVALVVYTVASVAAALAVSVQDLIVWRTVQGLSVGAGIVVGRAMIRDLFEPEDAQRLMSMVTLFFGLAPAVAPVIGGWLFVALGWRAIFWFLAAVGLLLVAVGWRFLPETLAHDARHSFHPRVLLRGYEEVGINARFLWLSLAVGFNFNAFFLYIVSAPVFLGVHLGLGPRQYAWLFIPAIAGIMTGAQLSGRAAGRLTPEAHRRARVRIHGGRGAREPRLCAGLPSHGSLGGAPDHGVRPRVRHGDALDLAHHARPLPHPARHGGLAAGLRLGNGEHAHRGRGLARAVARSARPRARHVLDDAAGVRLLAAVFAQRPRPGERAAVAAGLSSGSRAQRRWRQPVSREKKSSTRASTLHAAISMNPARNAAKS